MTSPPLNIPVSDPLAEPRRQRRELAWLAAIVLLALVLRLIHLGTAPYWHDEAHVLLKSEHIKEYLLEGEYESNHPPLFTVLVTLWRYAGLGGNEWTMRFLNVVLGLCGVVALYALGKYLFGARAGLGAGFLLAISPFHITHCQDLKEYVLLPFTAVLMVLYLHRAVEGNRPRQWALYALTAAIACYSEAFAAFILVSVNLWFLAQLRGRRDRLPGWILANLAGALMFTPWLHIMFRKAHAILIVSQSWWIPEPTLYGLLFYLKTIAFGYSDLDPHFKIAMVVFGVASLAGAVAAFQADWRKGLLLAMWFAPPIAMVYTVSLFLQSIFLIRSMMPFALPVYLWCGLAITRPRGALVRLALAACFAGIASIPLYQKYTGQFSDYEYPHRPGTHPPVQYKQATEYILGHWKDGDIVLQTCGAGWVPMYWYGLRGNQYTVALDAGLIAYTLDGNPPSQRDEAMKYYFMRQLQPVVEGKTRVWLVLSEWERQYLGNNPMAVWRWMDSHYAEIDHQSFDGFEVLLYASEVDGQPIRTIGRDNDDGVRHERAYAGGIQGAYTAWIPDERIRWTPPETRRGNLSLRFTEDATGTPVNLANDAPARTVYFEMENRADHDAQCRVEVLASDVLLEAASLYESNPDSNVWFVAPWHNPDPPPAAYELPSIKAHLTAPGPAALHGLLALAPGEYHAYLYACGAPGPFTPGRADLQFMAGGANLIEGLPAEQRSLNGWHWYTLSRVVKGPGTDPLPVQVAAQLPAGAVAAWADLAYAAFERVSPGETSPAVPAAWREDAIIPAHQTRRWAVAINAVRERFDVWVFERGEKGRAYRIFRRWND